MYSKLEQQKGSDENIHIEFVGQKGGRGKKIKKVLMIPAVVAKMVSILV